MASKIITANGNAQIDTSQSVFGGGSGLFDGAGDFLSTPDSEDFNFDGDFTIDFRFRVPAAGLSVFYSHSSDDGTNAINFYWNSGNNRLFCDVVSGGAIALSFYCPFAPSTNTWYHIEYARNGNTWYEFIDGVSQSLTLAAGAYSSALPNVSASLAIGCQIAGAPTNYFNGWLDEYRVSKGIARHTSGFTPPSLAYSTDQYTKLLLHMDGADGSASFVDSSVAQNGSPMFFSGGVTIG